VTKTSGLADFSWYNVPYLAYLASLLEMYELMPMYVFLFYPKQTPITVKGVFHSQTRYFDGDFKDGQQRSSNGYEPYFYRILRSRCQLCQDYVIISILAGFRPLTGWPDELVKNFPNGGSTHFSILQNYHPIPRGIRSHDPDLRRPRRDHYVDHVARAIFSCQNYWIAFLPWEKLPQKFWLQL
jgi:hypothetical protein